MLSNSLSRVVERVAEFARGVRVCAFGSDFRHLETQGGKPVADVRGQVQVDGDRTSGVGGRFEGICLLVELGGKKSSVPQYREEW
jgi:hypothetical protein